MSATHWAFRWARRGLSTEAIAPTLSVVALPIGAASDMAPRAAVTLLQADAVLSESPRGASVALKVARKLVSALGMPADLARAAPAVIRCDEKSTDAATKSLLAGIRGGTVRRAALISDAGTPAVSDPGCRVVAACHESGVRVSPVPGPSAVVAALAASGEGSFDGFSFFGWAPRGKSRLGKFLDAISAEPRPVVLLEAAPRLLRLLAAASDQVGLRGRPVTVCRELTKRHESVVRHDDAAAAATWAAGATIRGEVTLVIGARPKTRRGSETSAWDDVARRLRESGLDPDAVARCLHEAGCSVERS